MKHFMNARGALVREAIDGTLMLEGHLARLDGYPDIKVVVRSDWDRSKVAIVSGGGAGHEPAHAGFVGRGMLTAAVSGEVFASPSVDAVLAGILAVTGEAGCLLVVKNYTGDRLNFGLAAERARSMGLAVETVLVADDVAIPGAPQPRGVAGTLFVHKVAGHLAESGASLAAVKAAAQRVADSVASLGIALTSCTIPGQSAEPRMTATEAELGLGIHGEPGAEKVALEEVHGLVAQMATRLGAAAPEGRLAVLLNNLGGVPAIEMSVVLHALLTGALGQRTAWVFGPAALMTSLDMKGFSISVLALDDELEAALASPVDPHAWPRGRATGALGLAPLPAAMRQASFEASSDLHREAAFDAVCGALIAGEADLDALDAKIGDGDTGTTLASAARSLLAQKHALPFADLGALFAALSQHLSAAMGGSSGVLLGIFTAAVSAAMKSEASLAPALASGVARVQEYGGAREGDRTMLDALVPAVTVLSRGGTVAEAAVAARDGAERTAALEVARAGRSGYLRAETLRGVSDPGAVAVALVFEALAHLADT